VDPVDAPLTEAELREDAALIEADARILVPKRGKLFNDDGECKIAIIRPCVSRGKRLRGLPPIYEASMLARHAAVFGDWPMYMGHLSEALLEELREKERPLSDLGGRVVESWFEPDFTASYDDDFGYKPGATVGTARPQPAVRKMLEADPELLHVSINAWPTAAKPGNAYGVRGMIIEGIRRKPRGSVDWVYRGGAGGRPLAETDRLAVSILAEHYTSAPDTAMDSLDLKTATAEQLREKLSEENPDLLEALKAPGKPKVSEGSEDEKPLTAADLDAKLAERDEEIDDLVEERVQERLSERTTAEELETFAHKLIEGAGLPETWTADLKRRYCVLPSGPSEALKVQEGEDEEGKKTSRRDELKKLVEADLRHAAKLIESVGGRRPRVTGLGATSADPASNSTSSRREPRPAWREDLSLPPLKEGEKEEDALRESVRDGMVG
jgi:hypothetical protein